MSELPQRVAQGQRLSAHWLDRLLDYLRSRELRAGRGIKLTRTPSGTTIDTIGPEDPPEAEPLPALFSVRVFEGGKVGIYLPFGGGVSASNVVRVNGFDIPAAGLPTTDIDAARHPGWKTLSLTGLVRVRVTLPLGTSGGSWTIAAGGALKSDQGDGSTEVDVPIAVVSGSGWNKAVSQLHVGCVLLTHLEYTECGEEETEETEETGGTE